MKSESLLRQKRLLSKSKICSPDSRSKESGLTLIELVLVMVTAAILAGFVGNLIYYQVNTYEIVTNRKQGMQDARFALNLISRDIRQIVDADSIFQASVDSIRFEDINGLTIKYEFTNNQIYRNSNLLLLGVNTFTFLYYDDSASQMSDPINDPSDIRSIAINMTISVKNQTLTLRSHVTPRNF